MTKKFAFILILIFMSALLFGAFKSHAQTLVPMSTFPVADSIDTTATFVGLKPVAGRQRNYRFTAQQLQQFIGGSASDTGHANFQQVLTAGNSTNIGFHIGKRVSPNLGGGLWTYMRASDSAAIWEMDGNHAAAGPDGPSTAPIYMSPDTLNSRVGVRVPYLIAGQDTSTNAVSVSIASSNLGTGATMGVTGHSGFVTVTLTTGTSLGSFTSDVLASIIPETPFAVIPKYVIFTPANDKACALAKAKGIYLYNNASTNGVASIKMDLATDGTPTAFDAATTYVWVGFIVQ